MCSLGSCQLRSHFTVSWEKGTKRNKNINSWWNLITVPYAVSTNKVFQKKKYIVTILGYQVLDCHCILTLPLGKPSGVFLFSLLYWGQ
jgi:hypothetical protein